jgi:hypothetical protein
MNKTARITEAPMMLNRHDRIAEPLWRSAFDVETQDDDP